MKERFRKFIVSLKRQPNLIANFFCIVAFVFYSLNLTIVSNTTAKINSAGMGLCEFVAMLFSVLAFVCIMNAYPRRKKTNIPMLILGVVMMCGIIFADIFYIGKINCVDTGIDLAKNSYIPKTKTMLIVHIVLLALAILLSVLVKLYGKLLQKINTSIEVESNDSMEAIELSE